MSAAHWRRIHALLCEDWSPEQVAGWLRRRQILRISYETIYRHIWADLHQGGAATSPRRTTLLLRFTLGYQAATLRDPAGSSSDVLGNRTTTPRMSRALMS